MSTPQQPEPQGQPQERIVYVEKKKKGGCMKWGAIIVGVLLLIGLISAIAGGGDDESTTTSSGSDTSSEAGAEQSDNSAAPAEEAAPVEEAAPAEEESTEFVVGETYSTSKNLAITIDSVTTQADVFGDSYLVATVTYMNNGDEQVSFNPFEWEVQTPAGVVSDVAISGLDGALRSGELTPGGTITGNLHFEGTAPGEYRLIWKPSFSFSGDTATWVTNL